MFFQPVIRCEKFDPIAQATRLLVSDHDCAQIPTRCRRNIRAIAPEVWRLCQTHHPKSPVQLHTIARHYYREKSQGLARIARGYVSGCRLKISETCVLRAPSREGGRRRD